MWTFLITVVVLSVLFSSPLVLCASPAKALETLSGLHKDDQKSSHWTKMRFGTRAVHAGCEPEHNQGSVVPSIALSTTFTQPFPGVKPGKDDPNSYGEGYFYSRQSNPTRGALERALAVVEEGQFCSVFSSGLASFQSVIQLLEAGDHIIALDDLYGGTSGMFRNIIHPSMHIDFSFVNFNEQNAIDVLTKACTKKTKMLWIESPTNPLLRTMDIAAISKFTRERGIMLVVDNTFMSAYLQQPLKFGADIVVQSLTKHVAGHCDVVMGAAVTNNPEIHKRLRALQNFCGAVPSPFDCYLTLRGLKTLHVRVEAAQRNAMQLATVLESHPVVEKVIYPGLSSYSMQEVAKRQAAGPGTMITIYVKGGLPVAGKFLSSLKIFALAVSLGAVQSLACSPALMTHTAVPKEAREAVGLTDNLVRLSIGIEHVEDLMEDLQQALDAAHAMYLAEDQKKDT